ncbi:hypothetical protein BQ8794_50644 [Mesorhizobium prunaredense]|uniref:Uncharacterized protein n=1 Tax=Mesorhizobium prunaredense TaxID=1631249 RepID=A0A1R3VI58_9HYPH|nr:hypothetical protein BQ8794_50644 [Mesorhizobium prunaredense]
MPPASRRSPVALPHVLKRSSKGQDRGAPPETSARAQVLSLPAASAIQSGNPVREVLRTPGHDRWTALRRPATSFSQGAEWKALISKYIIAIPLSAHASCGAQIMSASPVTAVSSAMIAKVGAAASDSQSAAPRAATLSLGKSADTLSAGGIFCVWLEWSVIETSAMAVPVHGVAIGPASNYALVFRSCVSASFFSLVSCVRRTVSIRLAGCCS